MSKLKTDYHVLLTEGILKALAGKNIYTVLNFIEADRNLLASVTLLSYKDISAIKNHLINKHSAFERNALEYYEELLKKSAIISTGLRSVDNLLQGGLKTGQIYELCGLPASGKTQFCLEIAKNAISTLGQYVYYFDTKRDTSGGKIMNLFKDCTEETAAENMTKFLINQINTKHDLINCLYDIKNRLHKTYKFRLIIIDSLPPLIYQDSSSKSNGFLNQIVNIMRFLATEYHLVFLVTNVITKWIEGDFTMKQVSCKERYGCGKYWYNVANNKLKIEKNGDEYNVSIIKACTMSNNRSCTVKLY